MSLETMGRNGRVYRRKFDHEDAQRRYATGETIAALAAEYGVTAKAVERVVRPEVRARMYAAASLHGHRYRHDTCACGARKDKRAARCRDCHLREVLGEVFDAHGYLRCNRCNCYLPLTEFGFDAHKRERAFRRAYCRECEARARQDYRERHKVPCVVCGKPALPPSEKMTGGAPFPRCRECFLSRPRDTRVTHK